MCDQLIKMKKILEKNKYLFIIWATLAAFGAYFCTYAFRKPFSTGSFEGFYFLDMEFKTIAIIAQVIGYMLSKFIGVKVISELKAGQRIALIVGLVMVALFSLMLFAFVPAPYNALFMFLNGLPLGMVWGVIFSFLEGRRFTEFLGMGLSLNMIVTSGILKTCYLFFQNRFGFSDFEMPLVMGSIFFPLFLVFVGMLAVLPAPSKAEKESKMARKAMNKREKKYIWLNYFPGILMIILIYAFLTTLRDFRDNFAVEIWHNLGAGDDIGVYASTESLVGLVVIFIIGLLSLIKSNQKAFSAIKFTILFSLIFILFFTQLFSQGSITPVQWMIGEGIGFYLPYLLVQIAFFERMIPVLKLRGNAGYFVYLCDSIGYMGSVILLFFKEFFARERNYAVMLHDFSQMTAWVGIVFSLLMILFFRFRITAKKEVLELV